MSSSILRKACACLGVCLAVAGLAISPLPAADTWWHLAAGDYLLEQLHWPQNDPFSFTSGDYPWTNHEWLVEIIFSWLYSMGGLGLLYTIKILIITLAFGLLPCISIARHHERAPLWVLLAPCILWAGEIAFYCDVRAYLVTYLFLSLTVFSLLEYQKSEQKRWLVPGAFLPLLWVNCHGGFILGPAVMGVFGLVGPRRKEILGACAMGLLLSCINPYGPSMLLFPFSLLKTDAFSVGLNEWAKPELLSAQLPYLCLAIVYFVTALSSRKTLNWSLFFSTLAFVLLGLKAWRHEPLAALMLCYFLPFSLPEFKGGKRLAWALSLVALISGGLFFAERVKTTPVEKMALLEKFPQDAVNALRSNPQLPRELWNPYGWGGYLSWQLGTDFKVFFDGRAHTVYPEKVYVDGNYLQYGENWKKLLSEKGLQGPEKSRLKTLDEYGIDLVLVNKFQGNLLELLREPNSGWFSFYEDFTSVLFLRDNAQGRELASTFERPRDEWFLLQEAARHQGQPEELQLLEELLNRAPQKVSYRLPYALALLSRDDVERARTQAELISQLNSRAPQLGYLQARILLAENRKDEAIEALKREVERWPGIQPATKLLQTLTSST